MHLHNTFSIDLQAIILEIANAQFLKSDKY